MHTFIFVQRTRKTCVQVNENENELQSVHRHRCIYILCVWDWVTLRHETIEEEKLCTNVNTLRTKCRWITSCWNSFAIYRNFQSTKSFANIHMYGNSCDSMSFAIKFALAFFIFTNRNAWISVHVIYLYAVSTKRKKKNACMPQQPRDRERHTQIV